MRAITINLQIVKNLGNYETLRLGAEWTPDSDQTFLDAMAAGMAELNAAADMLTGKKPAAPTAPAANPVAQAAAEGNAEKLAKELDKALTQQPAAPQPDEFETMNAERDGDTREVMTLSAKKFNTTLGRIAAGVKVATVFEHYRFDADALAILRAFVKGERITLKAGDGSFQILIKAIEEKRNIDQICKAIQFADDNTAAAWDCAIKIS